MDSQLIYMDSQLIYMDSQLICDSNFDADYWAKIWVHGGIELYIINGLYM